MDIQYGGELRASGMKVRNPARKTKQNEKKSHVFPNFLKKNLGANSNIYSEQLNH